MASKRGKPGDHRDSKPAGQAVGKPGDRSDSPSDDDGLWRRVAAGVKPIDRNLRPRAELPTAELPATEPPTKALSAKPASRTTITPSSKSPPKNPQTAPTPRNAANSAQPRPVARWDVHGLTIPGVDGRLAGRFARGQMVIDATLDLHGSRQADAQRQLQRFVASSVAADHRCLLVITGKGRSRANPDHDGQQDTMRQPSGVIKRRLLDWLAMPGMAEHILAVKAAQPRHGGGGAFYVLLKRKRSR
ncbi:MAG: Smr/MutS family protein [Pseudomonadota bacterium]